ncbi:hypothetical protein BD779DRAFT_1682145 [Infundibulicybe gibba]|nr:hypothetical protein BD779DRAFT_1682145 [Infundibulicybe gibba]
MSQTPPTSCALSSCEQVVANPYRCARCGTAYCSASCYMYGALEHQPTCETSEARADDNLSIEAKMEAYANRHRRILIELAIAMAGRVAPGVRWLDHRVLAVYLHDGEDGNYVHYGLNSENFVCAAMAFGMLSKLKALVTLNMIGVMVFFVYLTPDGTNKVLAEALPLGDETMSTGNEYSIEEGVEALKASERLV